MSKKNKAKKTSPQDAGPETVEEQITEQTEEITETVEPDTRPTVARKKIDFVFCDKCGFQSPEDVKTCPTCKNETTPAYSSNPA